MIKKSVCKKELQFNPKDFINTDFVIFNINYFVITFIKSFKFKSIFIMCFCS